VIVVGKITRWLGAGLVVACAMQEGAQAAELRVVCAGAMRAVLQQLAPEYEKASGNKLTIEYATAGGVEKKVLSEDGIDVAILNKPRLDALVKKADIVGGSVAVLARAPIGLAVKKGMPHPDISSVDAVKKALLNASSIAYTDPASGGTSGITIAKELEKLGIATQLEKKIHLVSAMPGQASPRVGDAIVSGEADIGLQPISELAEVSGIEVVGPLPSEMQSPDLTYAAGSPAESKQPVAAKGLIDFLSGPNAAAAYKIKGLTPG